MQSGSVELRNIIQKILPPRADEKRGAYFYRAARKLGLKASRLKTIYYDPRTRLSFEERSRLQVNSDHISRVSLNNSEIRKLQGEVCADIIRQIKSILDSVDPDITSRR